MTETVELKSSVLCWGSLVHGQLGLGGLEEEAVTLPREIKSFRNVQVADIACGHQHTLFVNNSGRVLSCGNNDFGQLGHDQPRKRPGLIDSLGERNVLQASCGTKHSTVLTDAGQVFTWGNNEDGQLGRGGVDSGSTSVPRMVRGLSDHRVIQVACGSAHTLALTATGQIYTWGRNNHGQLGLANKTPHNEPHWVSCIPGLPIVQIAAGADHNLVLTISGALFGWGHNSFGQLGIGDDQDRGAPTLVKTLRTQGVCDLACGDDHSVALTHDGGVFTFGAGMYGQLGHNTTNNELLPRKVFELMGSSVTQIACGRKHSIAYVPSSGRVYVFGLGGNGQLGTGSTTNRMSPAMVKGPFVACGAGSVDKGAIHFSQHDQPHMVVKHLYAGGDQTFAYATAASCKLPPHDCRLNPLVQKIVRISKDVVADLSKVPAFTRPSVDVLQEITELFSSPYSWNASFLLPDPEHSGCSRDQHGIDLPYANTVLNDLSSLPNKHITEHITQIIGSHLLSCLPEAPADVECLRLFLCVPLFPQFKSPACYKDLQCPYASAVAALNAPASRILNHWFSSLPFSIFLRIVRTYKNTVIHLLSLPAHQYSQESLMHCMDLLNKFHTVNSQIGPGISYTEFYIPELKDKMDIHTEYIRWLQFHSMRSGRSFSICDYPFVFDGQAKTLLLQTDAVIQMQVAVDEATRHTLSNFILGGGAIDPMHPCLVLLVRRVNIVTDTINQLDKQGHHDFKKPLKVMFVGEEALDAGGVKKEFFLLLLREILDPKYGMFEYFTDSRQLWFSHQSFEDVSMYRLIGTVCGLAIYNGMIVDLKFPLALYKKLLASPLTLDDLRELQPAVGRSLQCLLEYEEDDIEETFCLTFEVSRDCYGELKTIPLIPKGSNITVNKENRQQYVDAYLDYVFNVSVKDQYSAFHDAFQRVCGGRVLEFFQPMELQAMVVGNEDYDWNQLEQNTDYKGEFHSNHSTIKFFWHVFHELSLEDKKKFLLFLTGSDRIPIHGMKSLKMIIQSTGASGSHLPVAHTCFNILDLPKYAKRQILKEKLVSAIENTEGFGLV